jgi:hypothetical protein
VWVAWLRPARTLRTTRSIGIELGG